MNSNYSVHMSDFIWVWLCIDTDIHHRWSRNWSVFQWVIRLHKPNERLMMYITENLYINQLQNLQELGKRYNSNCKHKEILQWELNLVTCLGLCFGFLLLHNKLWQTYWFIISSTGSVVSHESAVNCWKGLGSLKAHLAVTTRYLFQSQVVSSVWDGRTGLPRHLALHATSSHSYFGCPQRMGVSGSWFSLEQVSQENKIEIIAVFMT